MMYLIALPILILLKIQHLLLLRIARRQMRR